MRTALLCLCLAALFSSVVFVRAPHEMRAGNTDGSLLSSGDTPPGSRIEREHPPRSTSVSDGSSSCEPRLLLPSTSDSPVAPEATSEGDVLPTHHTPVRKGPGSAPVESAERRLRDLPPGEIAKRLWVALDQGEDSAVEAAVNALVRLGPIGAETLSEFIVRADRRHWRLKDYALSTTAHWLARSPNVNAQTRERVLARLTPFLAALFEGTSERARRGAVELSVPEDAVPLLRFTAIQALVALDPKRERRDWMENMFRWTEVAQSEPRLEMALGDAVGRYPASWVADELGAHIRSDSGSARAFVYSVLARLDVQALSSDRRANLSSWLVRDLEVASTRNDVLLPAGFTAYARLAEDDAAEEFLSRMRQGTLTVDSNTMEVVSRTIAAYRPHDAIERLTAVAVDPHQSDLERVSADYALILLASTSEAASQPVHRIGQQIVSGKLDPDVLGFAVRAVLELKGSAAEDIVSSALDLGRSPDAVQLVLTALIDRIDRVTPSMRHAAARWRGRSEILSPALEILCPE